METCRGSIPPPWRHATSPRAEVEPQTAEQQGGIRVVAPSDNWTFHQHQWSSGRIGLNRRGGGIEPLHVSMPRELKSRPSTSPTHPGFLLFCSSPSAMPVRGIVPSSSSFPSARLFSASPKIDATLCCCVQPVAQKAFQNDFEGCKQEGCNPQPWIGPEIACVCVASVSKAEVLETPL